MGLPAMGLPLCSIVTPTLGRPSLVRTCRSIDAQTYAGPWEHLVVADGPEAARAVCALQPPIVSARRRIYVLGRHWSPPCLGPGHVASNVGFFLAQGAYLTVLCDDDTLVPDAIARLVDACEQTGADYAYGQVQMRYRGLDDPDPRDWVCGQRVPRYGAISMLFFRPRCLQVSAYQPDRRADARHPAHDWQMIERWQRAGLKSVFVPRVLMLHKVDH